MFSKDLIIGIIPTANSTNIFIPELTYILRSQTAMTALSRSDPKLSHELKSKLLKSKTDANPPAILCCAIYEAVHLLERVYSTLLKAKIALPPTVHSNELNDWLKTDKDSRITKMPQFAYQISLDENDLGFYGKNLPWIGSLVTYTLTIGATLATATSIIKWSWGYALIALFAGSRLIANYHDIINGPENRMRKMGIVIDRYFSDPYQGIGKYSMSKLSIYFISCGIMICSAYLAFNSALFTIESICLTDYLPSSFLEPLSYFFASAVAYSHFGRIFNAVFDTIASKFKKVFDLVDSKEDERLDLDQTLKMINESSPENPTVNVLDQKSTYLGFSKMKKVDTTVQAEPSCSKQPDQRMRLGKARYAS